MEKDLEYYRMYVPQLEDTIWKAHSLNATRTIKLFRELYEEIKHRDEAHQKWLKDEIERFIESKITNTK